MTTISIPESFGQNYWALQQPAGLNIYNTNNFNNGYVGIGTGNLIPISTKLHLFMPSNAQTGWDRLSVLLESRITQNCPSFVELAIAKAPFITNYSSFATAGDAVLTHYGDCSEDLIITNKNEAGKLRFGTTESGTTDVERMTIIPDGRIGIWDEEPKNLFSFRDAQGIDFWNSDLNFQDVRFNCYASDDYGEDAPAEDTTQGDSYGQYYHHNIMGGHAAIIQSKSAIGQGGLLILVSGSYGDPGSHVEFFETYGGPPRGIILQSYSGSTSIGLGSLTDEDSRVKILGRTSDNTKNALKVVNWSNNSLFRVRNDGYIFIEKADARLHINGMICAKEVMVQLEGTPCWGDYVFDDDYKLTPLDELEKQIKKDKHLPGIPSAEEVVKNGLQIGEMQALMLKKIEELTLYVIELKKENDELKKLIKH